MKTFWCRPAATAASKSGICMRLRRRTRCAALRSTAERCISDGVRRQLHSTLIAVVVVIGCLENPSIHLTPFHCNARAQRDAGCACRAESADGSHLMTRQHPKISSSAVPSASRAGVLPQLEHGEQGPVPQRLVGRQHQAVGPGPPGQRPHLPGAHVLRVRRHLVSQSRGRAGLAAGTHAAARRCARMGVKLTSRRGLGLKFSRARCSP